MSQGGIGDWKYYNHAAVSSLEPHEVPDTAPVISGDIFKMSPSPLFARWADGFDCGSETNWWYVICDGPFSLETLSKSSRKSVRRALERCEVKKIDAADYIDDLINCYKEAIVRYKNIDNEQSEDQLREHFLATPGIEVFGGFDKESGKLIGYKTMYVGNRVVEFRTSKYSADYLKLRVSDALNFSVIDYYLNDLKKGYLSNGSRSINHETNVQNYYEEHFGFRKAYCRLHVCYKPSFKVVVKLFYPFRGIIKKMKGNIFHQITAVLRMEEIIRKG